jgi:undecaprenyl-diphosphatase
MREKMTLPGWLAARLGAAEVGPLAGLLAAAALLLLFGYLAGEVMEGDTHGLDRALLLALRHPENPAVPLGPPWLPEMARDVTALGSYAFLTLLVGAVIGYLLMIGKRGAALLVLVSVIGGMLLSTLLKLGFERPRPDLVPHAARVFTASFPSGHATLSAVTFLTLSALLARVQPNRRLKGYFIALALLLTLMVGVSRVYLGVHYPTDVLAGWCLGAAWAIGCWAAALWLQRRGQMEGAAANAKQEQLDSDRADCGN